MTDHLLFQSPLVTRYASRQMAELFGERRRILTWRRIWLSLAARQRQLGLPITSTQLRELQRTIDQIDFVAAARFEAGTRHDVMAHLHAWGRVAPRAKGILHLGATSADIVDNADLVIMRDALVLTAEWLANAIEALATFARRHRSLPALGMTHLQPAQLTSVGKRAATWCADFVRDLIEVEGRLARLRFRGIKGATGTQASFVELLGKRPAKVRQLEHGVARDLGFDEVEPITGQTYSRKIDAEVLATLGGIACSVHKFANDVRLLASFKELEEPFEAKQVGSSAMPYKRNPMLCERATALSRFVIALVQTGMQTAAEQWLERTLDDSANKRLSIPEAFLAVDGMLRIVTHVARGLVVNKAVIASRIRAELPFMATENILMAATAAGGDRQVLHERIRKHSHAAAARVKEQGAANDLLDRLTSDKVFDAVDIGRLLNSRTYLGLAPTQVTDFLGDVVGPIRRRYRRVLGREVDIQR